MKGLDGKKKEQAERLGMGLGIRRYDDDDVEETSFHVFVFVFLLLILFFHSGVSHSVTSDMHIIQQENPWGARATKGRRLAEEEDDEGSFGSRSDNDN